MSTETDVDEAVTDEAVTEGEKKPGPTPSRTST